MKKNLSAVAISVFVLALPWSVSAQMNQLPTFNLQFSFGNGSSVINGERGTGTFSCKPLKINN